MASLPPDDLPPEQVPTSEVDALVAAGPPGPDNPVTVGAVFWTAVTEPDGPDVDVLRIVVTPESWAHWHGFSRAAVRAGHLRILAVGGAGLIFARISSRLTNGAG